MAERAWHAESREEAAKAFGVDVSKGLDEKEARKRLKHFGPNKLAGGGGPAPVALFFKQLRELMVAVLIGAALISLILGELLDAAAVLAIVVVNAFFGFLQEYKAERSLEALKEMAAPRCLVRREGEPRRVRADEVVPGDVLLLAEGDRVAADARLVAHFSLQVDESPLTGESTPVRKDSGWTGEPATELADRRNMVYMGSRVVRGRGEAVVVATGMGTQIGEIAGLIQEAAAELTPLQRRLEQLSRWLVAFCLLIVAVVFAVGVVRGLGAYQMFLTAVSLSVAAIPEGLPAVVTVALALGVQRMIKRKAIVRKLPAVESLGCATVICSDKTGTLTKNQMTVTRLVLPSGGVEVSGAGYTPFGALTREGRPVRPGEADLERALLVCALCNDASLLPPKRGREGNEWRIAGDPTEGALVVVARKGGIDPDRARRERRRIGEIPFDADRKRMSVLVEAGGSCESLVKGAPDLILDRASRLLSGGVVRPMDPAERRRFKELAQGLAAQALRVLALAYRPVDREAAVRALKERGELPEELLETDLIFAGLVAMMDPPREEAARAVSVARRAGVETVMVTGDHPATAQAVARKIGLPAGSVLTGRDLDAMSDERLRRALAEVQVFARVSPRHKLRIVRALREMGHVVAMTGDGVNDAPAVKEADIGVAMGTAGTDVTREASEMVLADDNYATLVAAIEEGRGIYENVRKFIRYLLACNTGEVLAMLFAVALGMPLPLLPIQILWVNLVTDGLPAIALGVDPPDPGVMERRPRSPRESIFAGRLHLKIAVRGLLIGACTVVAFAAGAALAPPGAHAMDYARTLAFSTLVCSQLIYVFQCRSERRPLAEVGLAGNPWLVLAVAFSLALQVFAVHFPPLAAVLRTAPLSAGDWALVFLLSGWSQALETLLVAARRSVWKRISVLRV